MDHLSLSLIGRSRSLQLVTGFFLSLFLLNMALPSAAVAQAQTHYTDVPAGAWYEPAASALLDLGALDPSETTLRPNALATRAELVKLLVRSHGTPLVNPTQQTFTDVPTWAWYYPYFETAARQGWVKGDNNCAVTGTRPCTARPGDNVNRAEAAALLVRAYALSPTGDAPMFTDVWTGAWFTPPIQTAADHCILQGDAGTTRVRPAAFMNRAEMIAMAYRATRNQEYGVDCGTVTPVPNLSSVEMIGSTVLRLKFNTDLQRTRSEDESRYTITRVDSNATVNVTNASFIDNRTVDLTYDGTLARDMNYRVNVTQLLTTAGQTFSDSLTFRTNQTGTPELTDARMIGSNRVRLSFSDDLIESRAEDTARYTVTRTSNGSRVTINRATLLSARTVELELSQNLIADTDYTVNVLQLQTTGGDTFSDSMNFRSQASSTSAQIESVSVLSPTRLTVTFNQDLDEQRSEERFRYAVEGEQGAIDVTQAIQTMGDTVELRLASSLQNQNVYTVSASGLITADNEVFSDTYDFTYNSGSVMLRAVLRGANEVPAVATAATGTGTFTLTTQGLTYDITYANLTGAYTAAHFHIAPAGVNGSVVEPITFVNGRAQGTWTNLTAQERNALLNDEVYVNVHSDAYPNGEIRGQLIVQ